VRRRSLAVAALFIGLAAPVSAAPARFSFYDRGPYRAGVPRPADVLGYDPGTFHTGYGNMERYVDALVHAAPDRTIREPFGRTCEFRERALLIITSPANQRRLAAIREATARLADPRLLRNPAEAERLIRETPVTVWLNYSIHGDESASFEAMAQVAYQLAAGEDSVTRAILDSCVVIVNLAHNPDGHERFVTWINALGQGNPDPWAIEQQRQQPWGIGGRTNHYQLDLNRDALAMSQVETQQMAAAFLRWHPQVFADHHGQTESYFFPPTAAPMNEVFPIADVVRWNERYGRANATAFDRYGWNYFVRDVFDFFYPGYWDIWPALYGAVGMTYETDGGGNLALRRDDETIVTLLDGIQRHFVASLATCAMAAEARAQQLRDFHRLARATVEAGRRGPVRAYAIDAAKDPVRAAALAENLLHAGVEVMWIGRPFRAGAARPVWQDAPAPARGGRSGAAARVAHEFQKGAFIVDLAQPGARAVRSLLELESPIDSAFARTQLEKYGRNLGRGRNASGERYDFYDITAWSLPVSYGVETFALSELPSGGQRLAAPDPGAPDPAEERLADSSAVGVPQTARRSRWAPLVLRDARGDVVLDLRGGIEGGSAATAYVWSGNQDGAVRLTLRLLQEGFKVATSPRPLRAGGRDFPRGSFLARVERNAESLHDRIAGLAKTCGVRVVAVNTAYTDRGDTGIGSASIASLKRPNIAVLVDGPVSPNAYGSVWFLLERRIGYRFTALRADALGAVSLERYNVIVIPDGEAGALAGSLGAGAIAKLKDWIGRGGTLVCLDDAAEFPTLKNVGLSTARPVGVRQKKKDEQDDPESVDAVADSTAREEERRPEYIPGTIFWATPDPRHFLSFGLDAPHLPVMLQGRLFLTRSKEGVNPIVFDREPLRLSGWTWPETERRLEGTAWAVDEPTLQGHVIMIVGSPAFRLCWRSTERILLNAVLFGPALD
jgi:hypothetical protein